MYVSVIIPFFNAGKFLKDAVGSALQQPETGEVIIVDDGSTDHSFEIAKSLQSPLVKLYQLNQNSGPAIARNHGILQASFPLIAFLDADDIYLKDRFSSTLKIFQQTTNQNLGVVYGAVLPQFSDEDLRKKYSALDSAEHQLIHLKPENIKMSDALSQGKYGIIHLDAITVKREVLQAISGFDPSLRQMEDTDLLLRLSLITEFQAVNPNEPLAIRNIHGHNLTIQDPSKNKWRLLFLKKWILLSLRSTMSYKTTFHFIRSYLGEHPYAGMGKYSLLKTTLRKTILLFELLLKVSHGGR